VRKKENRTDSLVPARAFAGTDQQVGQDGIMLSDLKSETAQFVFGRFRFHIPGRRWNDGEPRLARRDIEASGS
jgi:hypothetical protein